tara:strand:- start:1743 stop:2387 length:645 start_codon:yes stop_codon:yes gene_type:complete
VIVDNKYRLYGRSKGRGKCNQISNKVKNIKIKKIDSNKYNIIDIGVGYGESTLEIAKTNSNKFIIACEKYIDGVNKIADEISISNMNNINIFHGNVHQLLDEYCANKSISEIWILFPDPWPKKRHFKRRLINKNFLKKIKNYLKDKAIIHIASDSKSYISEILLSVYELRNDYKWDNQKKEGWDYAHLSMPKTKYFKKALKKGDKPFYLKLIKL